MVLVKQSCVWCCSQDGTGEWRCCLDVEAEGSMGRQAAGLGKLGLLDELGM